ncbi:MAG: hypothetical protein HYV13_01350 [Candidatus Doudnabacteria bacterium]|nr:hypothetical protein [Candidatus Doudnabacteria bacterium]
MKALMTPQKQKFLSTLIVSVGAFLGFEALSLAVGLYQIKTYLELSIYIYLFHVFWLTFIFDLHLKERSIIGAILSGEIKAGMFAAAMKERFRYIINWHHFRHLQNFLILPGVIYWAVVALLFLNLFKESTKQVIVVSASLAMTVAYWYFKDFLSKKLEMHEVGVRVLALVKLYAAFLIFSAALGLTWYFGMHWSLLVLAVFALTFILIYQALFQLRLLSPNVVVPVMAISLLTSATGYIIHSYWGINYLTGGLVITGVYNSLWGIIHHHLEKNLTKKLAFEYVAMLVLILSVLAAGQDFAPRID